MSSVAFIGLDQGFVFYTRRVSKIPMLTLGEERDYANRWYCELDIQAAQKLVTSHLRLVVKEALRFRHYGLPVMDLISEGNIGLMKAVKNFNPNLGCRVSTYALWWINASIKDFVVRSWSVVKIGSGSAKRRLFFNLKKMKRKFLGDSGRDCLTSDEVSKIASDLKVSEKDVLEMDSLLSHTPLAMEDEVGGGKFDGPGSPMLLSDTIVSGDPNQEELVMDMQERGRIRKAVASALEDLDDRCRDIFIKRRLSSPISTLEDLSKIYGVSKERIRQIEKKAESKLRESLADFLPCNENAGIVPVV